MSYGCVHLLYCLLFVSEILFTNVDLSSHSFGGPVSHISHILDRLADKLADKSATHLSQSP